MSQDNIVISAFSSHDAADEAVKELSQNGFDMTKLSIVGNGYHSEEHAVGFYTVSDRIKSWGTTGRVLGRHLRPAAVAGAVSRTRSRCGRPCGTDRRRRDLGTRRRRDRRRRDRDRRGAAGTGRAEERRRKMVWTTHIQV
ncbi:hypothetical protein [Paraburkholderia sp. CI3]|uniref:hypothetical protein n=1 Tax=Paraburkholderia sp. CI3 TaxID=2991060 RepID=UPI003D22598F